MGIERFCIGNFQTVTSTETIPGDLPLEMYKGIVDHYLDLPPEQRITPQIIEFNSDGYFIVGSEEKRVVLYSDPADRFGSIRELVWKKFIETKAKGVPFIAIIVDHKRDGLDTQLIKWYSSVFGSVSAANAPCTEPAYKQ